VESVGDDDGLGVEDEADDSLARVRPTFRDLVVKAVQLFDPVLCPIHFVLVLLALPGGPRILALDKLAQPGDIILPYHDRAGEGADGGHDGVCSILVGRAAEGDDLLSGLAAVLARHARVGVHGGRASDVGSGEKDDAAVVSIVVFSEAEVEGTGALVVGRLERGNEEAGRGREGLAGIGDGVDEGVEGVELRATKRVGHLRLAESNLNTGEAGLADDSTLDVLGGSHCNLEGESLGPHADPHQERAKRLLLPFVGEAEAVDRSPHDVARGEVFLGVLTDLGPGVCDWMVTDRAQLADVGLRFCTLALRPGRTRLEDAGSPAGRTIEVGESVGVMVGETGRVGGEGDAALVDDELLERVASGRGEGRGYGDWRLVSGLLEDGAHA